MTTCECDIFLFGNFVRAQDNIAPSNQKQSPQSLKVCVESQSCKDPLITLLGYWCVGVLHHQ